MTTPATDVLPGRQRPRLDRRQAALVRHPGHIASVSGSRTRDLDVRPKTERLSLVVLAPFPKVTALAPLIVAGLKENALGERCTAARLG
jgi:hypothetical protein